MTVTRDQLEAAERALAFRLRDKGYTGARLDRALEECAQGIMDSAPDTVAAAALREIWQDETGPRWARLRNGAKRRLTAMGRPT